MAATKKTEETKPYTGKPRGFAAMSLEKRRAIASKGGSALSAEKRSFSRDPELAAKAGKIGGSALSGKKSFAADPERAAKIGRLGGKTSKKK